MTPTVTSYATVNNQISDVNLHNHRIGITTSCARITLSYLFATLIINAHV